MYTYYVCYIKVINYLFLTYIAGNPTRFAPKPKPAPWRADAATLGINVSKIENVVAATKPKSKISSIDKGFLGKIPATKATTRPSNKYFTARLTKSITSTFPDILYIFI